MENTVFDRLGLCGEAHFLKEVRLSYISLTASYIVLRTVILCFAEWYCLRQFNRRI